MLRKAIEKYMDKYNTKRLHSAIEHKTSNEVYFEYINNLDFRGWNKECCFSGLGNGVYYSFWL